MATSMETKRLPVVVGIDVGTSGIRLSAVDISGQVVWSGNEPLAAGHPTAEGIHEQHPSDWWSGVCRLGRELMRALPLEDHEILGVAVTSTSGTLVAVDGCGNPVRPAILYDDQRASFAARELNLQDAGGATCWAASHSLTKALWLRNAEPRSWERVVRLLHPTDWITGKLTGQFDIADHSNALKMGFEVETGEWNGIVERSGIRKAMLPRIVRSGELVGRVCVEGSAETGLPEVPVIAGATDGIAGLIASGAASSGDANTTLGTTLVWKVLSDRKPASITRNIYCHLHPSGLWAPGAASNTGPGSISLPGGVRPSEELDVAALNYLPSRIFCYPISGMGERFPFLNSETRGFMTSEPANMSEGYAAQLQAIAFVERWGYEVLEQSGVWVGATVYSTGGAASSKTLSRLRASALNRRVVRCSDSNAAFGAAILAASAVYYGGQLSEAIRSMTHLAQTNLPESDLGSRLNDAYGRFQEECRRRGYYA